VSVVAADINGKILQDPNHSYYVYALTTGTVQLNGVKSTTASGPATLSIAAGATGTVTFSDIKDSAGNVVPDGSIVVATVADSVTRLPGSTSANRSPAGGTLEGGTESNSGIQYKYYTVQNGTVTVTYSTSNANVGTALVQLIPGNPDGTVFVSGSYRYTLVGGVWPISITP
jgi:hypothetical protein